MKRDFDIIRQLLLDIEQSSELVSYSYKEDGEEIIYHLKLLDQAGFIRGSGDKDGYSVMRLTWEGHDFLDAIRSDTVWNRTKEKVSKTVGSASLEIIKAVAQGVSKSMLGLS